jgi:hypothetical protein
MRFSDATPTPFMLKSFKEATWSFQAMSLNVMTHIAQSRWTANGYLLACRSSFRSSLPIPLSLVFMAHLPA